MNPYTEMFTFITLFTATCIILVVNVAIYTVNRSRYPSLKHFTWLLMKEYRLFYHMTKVVILFDVIFFFYKVVGYVTNYILSNNTY